MEKKKFKIIIQNDDWYLCENYFIELTTKQRKLAIKSAVDNDNSGFYLRMFKLRDEEINFIKNEEDKFNNELNKIYQQTNDEVNALMFFGRDLTEKLKERLVRRAIYLDKGERLLNSCVHYLTQKERELAFNNAIKNKGGHLLLDGYCYKYLTEKEKKICIYNAIANGKGAYLLRYCFNKLTEEEMKLACQRT